MGSVRHRRRYVADTRIKPNRIRTIGAEATKRSGSQNAHNHPSGVAEPSQADELITQRIKEALALVDIRLLDHIIIGDGASVSLAERGVI